MVRTTALFRNRYIKSSTTDLQALCAYLAPCYCYCHATTSISVHEPFMFFPCKILEHLTALCSWLRVTQDVTSRLPAFSLLLPHPSDPATNAPWFLPEVGVNHKYIKSFAYLSKSDVYVAQRVFVMPNMDDLPISLMCAHIQPDSEGDHEPSGSLWSASLVGGWSMFCPLCFALYTDRCLSTYCFKSSQPLPP